MPSLTTRLREGVVSRLGGLAGEQRRLVETKAKALDVAVRTAPWWFTPSALLREFDPQMMSFLMQMQDYEVLSQGGNLNEPDESQRQFELQRARFLYRYDPIAAAMVGIITDFGMGRKIRLSVNDQTAAEDWKEFTNAKRNKPVMADFRLRELSHRLLVDGEIFLLHFISKIDGQDTIRCVPSDEVSEILSTDDDPYLPILYKRTYTIRSAPVERYYRDWTATDRQLETLKAQAQVQIINADDDNEQTIVRCQHIRLPGLDQRGWTALASASPWINSYTDFLRNRAALSRAVASIVNDVTVKGGQRAVDYFKRLMQSSHVTTEGAWDTNPPPAAASDFVHNEQVNASRMPLSTAAGDARYDGLQLIAQAGTGNRIPAMWLGRPDAMQNRATAEITMKPAEAYWANYNAMWAQDLRDMLEIVCTYQEQFAGKVYSVPITELTSEVTAVLPWETDLTMFTGTLLQGMTAGLMRTETAAKLFIARQEWGIDDPDEEFKKWQAEQAAMPGAVPAGMPGATGPEGPAPFAMQPGAIIGNVGNVPQNGDKPEAPFAFTEDEALALFEAAARAVADEAV